ncbi:mycothione reductase [Nocardioides sp.]|uniref:mycothione reductase n=1 Tax=Nocardioides sp. TaxID=35761 RepID=UPI003518C420
MTHYDVVILGAGSGNSIVHRGYAGLRVAIVEPGPWGGTCLNRGCIPSKMFVVPADLARAAADDGARLDLLTHVDGVDWPGLHGRVFARTDDVAAQGLRFREEQPHVDVLRGRGRFLGPGRLRIDLLDGTAREVTAAHVVIATGSHPVVPDLPGLAGSGYDTSDDLRHLTALPARLAILGGGYVGTEFAHVFASLGRAAGRPDPVVQLERGPVLLGAQDEEIARRFTAQARQQWDVRTDAALERVTRDADGLHLHLAGGEELVVDRLLVAVGRRPTTDDLGLEHVGVEVDDAGRVVVDEHQRTTAAGVWALGDASSPEPLKHVANQDARVVAHNILHPDDLRVSDHRFVPQAVFSSPQVAAVGLTEAQARDRGIDAAVTVREYAGTAYGWAQHHDDAGWCVKLLADRATGRLVGAHLIGPMAATLIQPLIQAMSFDQPVAGLARGQYWIHPAPTEVVENALLDLARELAPPR